MYAKLPAANGSRNPRVDARSFSLLCRPVPLRHNARERECGTPGPAILLSFNLPGMLLRRYGHVPLPENVLGMMLLFGTLWTGVVKAAWLGEP
jgi:hypothetical protein